jgi:hypothetical protein
MLYKTTVLELLNQRRQMQEQPHRTGKLLTALEFYARELKTRHEAWKELLTQAKPGHDQNQITSMALEMALKELEDRLPPAFGPNATGPLSLEAAMAFVRSHMPSA